MNYNLENRTAEFGENIIKLVKEIPKNSITKPLISQIVRSSIKLLTLCKQSVSKQSVSKQNL